MKQVVQNYKTGKIKLEEVSPPFCKSGGIIVRNICSAVSVGTERLMIDMAKKSLLSKALARPDLVRLAYQKALKEGFISVFKEAMNRLDESIPMGYSSSGEVVEIGEGVEGFKVGDRVVCAGAGFAVHAEYIWVPDNLCNKFSDELDFESASFGMIGAIAVNGIRKANLSFGENVAVLGLGLIGLITVQILKSYGCRVVGIDIDESKVKLAEELKVDLGLNADDDDILSKVENFTQNNGFDAVIITAASNDVKPVRLAEDISRKKGRIVLVGVADLKLTRKIFWEKELSFIVSRAAGVENDYPPEISRWTQKKNIEHFIDLLVKKKVKMDKLITHYFEIEEALKCYEMILKKKKTHIGVAFRYDNNLKINNEEKETKVVFFRKSSNSQISASNVGFIGGGNFSKNILLPALGKIHKINLVGIATTKGISSQQVGKKFGFNYCSSDYKDILYDKSIGSVIISTPHNLHSKMVIDALEAGKNVFVEKPLCININELKQIVKIFSRSGQRLMVGFNRRFSSLAMQAKSCWEKRNTALMMNYRVNAGNVADGHWVNNVEISGGRIIGEVCHFVDFFQFITDAYPQKIYLESIGGHLGKYNESDNVCLTMCFSDGSVGTIIYTTKGTRAFSRERVEIFSEDSVVTIEDFKKLTIVRGNKKKQIVKLSQDLGYINELNYFFDSGIFEQEKLFKQYLYTTLTTFKALDSLKIGNCVKIELEEILKK
ncbi:bi-domain-containing oxidoreductase [bacterium]|nr:bi-domain-containing oxidoreductase [bacterium]